jgi:hypothetical protein
VRAWTLTTPRAACSSVVKTTTPKTTENTQPPGVSIHAGLNTIYTSCSQGSHQPSRCAIPTTGTKVKLTPIASPVIAVTK